MSNAMQITVEMQKRQQARNMFGCDIDEFVKSVKDSITYKTAGVEMVVMSMLSDAQHEIEYNMDEAARQNLNRAKYLLTLKMQGEI